MDYNNMNASQQGSMLNRMLTPLLKDAGYVRRKAQNTDGAQITEIERNGHVARVVYKTSRNRWFSMHPSGENGWKPLDGADGLALVTVDDPEAPTQFQLYVFPAAEVRKHLDAGKAAWTEAEKQMGFGLWLFLDPLDKAHHAAGSGLAKKHSPEATIQITEGGASAKVETGIGDQSSQSAGVGPLPIPAASKTIAQVLNDARAQIAAIAAVAVDAVRLDLHIGG